VYDGIWSIRSIPDFKGIGGSINQVNVDTVRTKAFNDTVWRNPPQANLTKYRTNPNIFYKIANLNSWDGCRSSSGNVDPAMCNMQTDEYGMYQCDSANELGDGYCSSACNNAICGWDGGDCCSPDPNLPPTQEFKVYNYIAENEDVQVFGSTVDRINEVFIGGAGTNRVVGGVLVSQTRRKMEICTEQTHVSGLTAAMFGATPHLRFKDLANKCPNPYEQDELNYGFDAQFLSASTLYSAAVVEEQSILYPQSTDYDTATNLPYGFKFHKYSEYTGGFPIFFDINLDNAKANNYITYMQDGGYIDSQTEEIKMYLTTYNAPTGVFGALIVTFEFKTTGFIEIDVTVESASVQPYRYDADLIRLVLELLFVIGIVINAIVELGELVSMFSWDDPFEVFDYFQEVWNYLDVLNIVLLSSTVFNWFIFNTVMAPQFKPKIRYDVYDPMRLVNSPDTQANWFRVTNLAKMQSLYSKFELIESVATWQNYYIGINGVSFIIMIFRTLKMLNFQPRVGVVTRTLDEAAGDLVHFIIVFAIITIGYAIVGHLNFGHAIEAFSTIPLSLNTCAEMLLGEIGMNEQLIEQSFIIPPLLFFWSYIFVAFFILINILLAIIIDSYAAVKKKADDTTPMPKEVTDLLLGRLGGILACDSRRSKLERDLKKKYKWNQLVEDAEEKAALNASVKKKRKRLLEVNVENKMVDVDLEKLIGIMYTGLKGAKKITKKQARRSSTMLNSALNKLKDRKSGGSLIKRSMTFASKETKTLKLLAKKINKMEKGLAPPRAAARKKAELQAKAILKYFGKRKKVAIDTAPKEIESKSETLVMPLKKRSMDEGKEEQSKNSKKKNTSEFDFDS
jgi:hypothetical protein